MLYNKILTKEQYMKMSSNYDCINTMYEMKMGHELKILPDSKYRVSFLDEQTHDHFVSYVYEPFLICILRVIQQYT